MLDYDPATGLLRWKSRSVVSHADKIFNAKYAGKVAGCKTDGEIVINIRIDGKQWGFRAHRIAWAIYYGVWPHGLIDHENCDPHDNRLLNLRESDSSGNNSNRSVVRGASRFKGVSVTTHGKWCACLCVKGKQIWLGSFSDELSAARAYDEGAISTHGVFAKTNASLGLFTC